MNDQIIFNPEMMLNAINNYYIRTPQDVLGKHVEDITPCQEMVIHYKLGNDYHVSNPFDITVFEAKGGGYNMRYTVKVDAVVPFESGRIHQKGEETVEVDSRDIVGVTCFHRLQDNGVRRAIEIVFGAE